MLQEIRLLGFEYAELSHGIRISLLPGVFAAVEAGDIKISSLHNFCPLPIGVDRAAPNLYQFSSPNPRERENAIKHTLKTIEVAERVGAPVVVLHLGSVETKDYTDRLVDLLEKGQKESAKYNKLFEEAFATIEARKETHVAWVREVLDRIIPEAQKRKIRLGVENREALEEIPMDGDLHFFFKDYPEETVGYWHDTGHAQIKENLGVLHHSMQLQSLAARLIGFHIHDVHAPASDHRTPGTGMVDFASLKPAVQPQQVKVFEFSPSLSPEQALAGVAHIYQVWGRE